MAKLSVYNTIDRSQLGGKFVPLIQSGVSNYKILASDLGKEYHPGDAIEITDTGEINVKFSPGEFEIVNSYLSINPDDARGVFNGSNGLYIASADSTINVSSSGIKVNTSFLAGDGLRNNNGSIYVKSADNTIDVTGSGVRVYYDSGLKQDSHGRLIVNDTYVIHTISNSDIAGNGLYWSNPGYPDSALYVKSADNTINVSSEGIKVNTYALAGDYISIDAISHHITVDTASVARAITGSGLVTTNGAIGVNVNTATGIIVKDNKLYLNAGNGLQTTNNAVSVKSANDSIGVSSSGVKVNVKSGGGVVIGSEGLYIDSGALSVGEGLATKSGKLTVNLGTGGGIMFGPGGGALWVNPDDIAGYGLLGYSGTLYVKSADSSIDVHQLGIRVNVGSGLWLHEGGLCVRSADSSIDLSGGGISVNTSSLSHSLPGKGLYSDGNKLSVYIGSGLRFSSTGAIESTSPSAGPGLMEHTNGYLQVKSSDGSIYVDNSGISVDLRNAEYIGSGLSTSSGKLAVKSADSSIGVSENGIRVNAGYGLETTSSGLYVKSADNTIGVGGNGIKVNPSALAGDGLSTDAGKLYVKSADGTIGVTSSGIGVNVTNGGGILTGANGLYIDSAQLAGSGLMASSIEQHNVKLNVNVGLYDSSSNNNGTNLLKINTATNELYVSGVDVTGIIGTNNTMTREQDSSSYYHRFGVDVNYLFSVYTDRSTLIYKGNSLGVHLASIAGEGLGYNPESKSLYTSSGGSGGSILGVAVSTPNNQHAYASDGGIALGESAVTGGANSIAIGRLIHLTSDSTEAVAIGYTASATGVRVVAIGSGSYAKSGSAVAIGNGSIGADRSAAVGAGSEASGTYSLSAGYMSRSKGPESVALGVLSVAHNSGTAIGSTSYSMSSGVAVGYNSRSHAYAASFGCSSSSDVVGVSIGYQASAGVGSVAIGYQASAYAGMVSIKATYSNSATFSYLYGPDGSIYSTDTLGKNYSRSWANLLTPPDYTTAVSINPNTEYTADRPAYIVFNVYAGGDRSFIVSFIKNGNALFEIGVLYGLTTYNVIPVSKGETYKLQVTDNGATNPAIYAYRIYPK